MWVSIFCIFIVDVLEDVKEGAIIVSDEVSLMQLSDVALFHALNQLGLQ